MKWENWVIDATISTPDLFCFVPVEGDINEPESLVFVTGMNYLENTLPKGAKIVAVIHRDGDEAADKFYEENKKKRKRKR